MNNHDNSNNNSNNAVLVNLSSDCSSSLDNQPPSEQTHAQLVGLEIQPIARTVFIVVTSLMVLSGVCGNILVLSNICSPKNVCRQTTHNIILRSLSLADLIISGYWLPFFVLDLSLGHMPVVNGLHCAVNSFVFRAVWSVSIVSLAGLTFTRFMQVCHIKFYKRYVASERGMIILCTLIWSLSLLTNAPHLFKSGLTSYDPASHMCSTGWCEGKKLCQHFVLLVAGIPLVLIVFCNVAIFMRWRAAQLKLRRAGDGFAETKARSRAGSGSKRASKMIELLDRRGGFSVATLPKVVLDEDMGTGPDDYDTSTAMATSDMMTADVFSLHRELEDLYEDYPSLLPDFAKVDGDWEGESETTQSSEHRHEENSSKIGSWENHSLATPQVASNEPVDVPGEIIEIGVFDHKSGSCIANRRLLTAKGIGCKSSAKPRREGERGSVASQTKRCTTRSNSSVVVQSRAAVSQENHYPTTTENWQTSGQSRRISTSVDEKPLGSVSVHADKKPLDSVASGDKEPWTSGHSQDIGVFYNKNEASIVPDETHKNDHTQRLEKEDDECKRPSKESRTTASEADCRISKKSRHTSSEADCRVSKKIQLLSPKYFSFMSLKTQDVAKKDKGWNLKQSQHNSEDSCLSGNSRVAGIKHDKLDPEQKRTAGTENDSSVARQHHPLSASVKSKRQTGEYRSFLRLSDVVGIEDDGSATMNSTCIGIDPNCTFGKEEHKKQTTHPETSKSEVHWDMFRKKYIGQKNRSKGNLSATKSATYRKASDSRQPNESSDFHAGEMSSSSAFTSRYFVNALQNLARFGQFRRAKDRKKSGAHREVFGHDLASNSFRDVVKVLRSQHRRAREKGVVRALLLAVCLCFLSLLPHMTVTVVDNYYYPISTEVYMASRLMLFAGSSFNWMVFMLVVPSMRSHYAQHLRSAARICTSCCGRKPRRPDYR